MKNICTLLAAVLLTATTYAQIGINNENPDASAALDITSTTGGLLVPRMTETQRDAISPAATGLMIYQTDGTAGFYYYNGSSWDTYYSKNEVDTILTNLQSQINGFRPEVGDRHQGGIVFYIYQSGDLGYVEGETHGLITAFKDVGYDTSSYPPIQWASNENQVYQLGNTGTAIGTGRANTWAIFNTIGSPAAEAAIGYSYGGWEDWFLPSRDELEKLVEWSSLNCQGPCCGNYCPDGFFSVGECWSSSEYDPDTETWDDNGGFPNDYDATSAYCNLSGIWVWPKTVIMGVRAVRAF
tara:strand:+ start:33 stop:923 length:891 start_codon:yes stop_codon:yes gene_type:complete